MMVNSSNFMHMPHQLFHFPIGLFKILNLNRDHHDGSFDELYFNQSVLQA